jgi:hypothetical protein
LLSHDAVLRPLGDNPAFTIEQCNVGMGTKELHATLTKGTPEVYPKLISLLAPVNTSRKIFSGVFYGNFSLQFEVTSAHCIKRARDTPNAQKTKKHV